MIITMRKNTHAKVIIAVAPEAVIVLVLVIFIVIMVISIKYESIRNKCNSILLFFNVSI